MADEKTKDLLIEGTLLMKLLDQPTEQGWVTVPGIAKLEVSHKADIVDAPASKDRGSYGQVPASAAKPKPTELKLSLSRTIGKALPMGLMGTQTSATQASGTLTDHEVTAILDQGVELGKRGFADAGFTVKNSAGSTTYVEGTDYTVNRRLGLVFPLSTGAITDGQALKVSGSYGALAWNRLTAGNTVQWKVALRIDGVNLFKPDEDLDLEIPSALLTSDSPIDFMSDKAVEIGFSGRVNGTYILNHGITTA